MNNITYLHVLEQDMLFQFAEEKLGPLTEKQLKFIQVLEMVKIESFISSGDIGVGRPKEDRQAIARAFIAKAVFNIPMTTMLIERLLSDKTFRRLCGWFHPNDVPSESSFSRAFAEFANFDLAQQLHTDVIAEHYEGQLVFHVSRDATEIEAREKPIKKDYDKKECKQKPKKRGRPKKDEVRPEKEKTRLEKQETMSSAEMLADLPKQCDVGTKKNSKGYKESWIGYKLHIDSADGDIPISCVLTSASVHDSQVALPLTCITTDRINYLYDVCDAAYDSQIIRDYSEKLGHVPIIDNNPGRGQIKIEFDPAKKERYKVRSTAERVNSRLKDEFGARWIWVRGYKKVFTHLMFGVLVLTVSQILKWAT